MAETVVEPECVEVCPKNGETTTNENTTVEELKAKVKAAGENGATEAVHTNGKEHVDGANGKAKNHVGEYDPAEDGSDKEEVEDDDEAVEEVDDEDEEECDDDEDDEELAGEKRSAGAVDECSTSKDGATGDSESGPGEPAKKQLHTD